MNIKTLDHQINLSLIRQTQFSLEYKEQNGALLTEIHSPHTGLISGTIYFEDKKVMNDFQNCLKDPNIHFYVHPKVTTVLIYLKK